MNTLIASLSDDRGHQRLERAVRALVSRSELGPHDLRAIPGALTRIFMQLPLGRRDFPEIAVDPERRWGAIDLTPEDSRAFAIRVFRWLPGAFTTKHDHPAADPSLATVMSFVRVLSGELNEDTYAETGSGSVTTATRRRLVAGQESFAHAGARPHIHRLLNAGTVEAHSVHVYVPAVSRESMRDYGPDSLRAPRLRAAGETPPEPWDARPRAVADP